MVFCIQNSGFSTKIASFYGSQPSSVVLCITTATLWAELIVSIGPRLHLSLSACERAWLAPELPVSMGPRPHLSFGACKTTWLASELLVSMCPTPHLWFLYAKKVIIIRITNLYGSQPSSVVFVCKTATFGSELQVSVGPRIHLSLCACETSWLAPE